MKTKLIILPTCRKAWLFIVLAFYTFDINAQSYFISFAGTGASTSLDSVKVVNLTHDATVKLDAGDILNLFGTDGINELNVNDKAIQICPNPMQGQQAEISFYAAKSGEAQLAIYDLLGKKILQISDNVSQGIQKFQLSGITQGVYFINVSGENYSYRSKMISLNTSQSEVKIKHIESSAVNDKEETIVSKSKSTKSTVAMAYTTGDYLRFIGYSGTLYTSVVGDVPSGSKTITFTFVSCTDMDNNHYPVVQIGSQYWLKENLKTTKYNDGTGIGSDRAGTLGAYVDNPQGSDTYGRLYNWYAVNTGILCPLGFHVASEADWNNLSIMLGNPFVNAIKEAGTAHWSAPNSGTNSSGFTALPAGMDDGGFYSDGGTAVWWTSEEIPSFMYITPSYAPVPDESQYNESIDPDSRFGCYSVRCVMN